jgi:glycosyltransferase involved in cell wall biosynthesis
VEVQALTTSEVTVQALRVARLVPELSGPIPELPKHLDGVVAVIPAYNEERFIASVVISALQYVDRVIVVDDGSSDMTAFLAEMAGAEVIRQPSNMGKARALTVGFQAALTSQPVAVVCLDGDAQHRAVDLPKMVHPVMSGLADVVIGSRFLEVRNEAPKWRQAGQLTLTAVTNTASGVRVTDSQSGFRAFSPQAVRALQFSSAGLSVESEMQFALAATNLRVTEVPIEVHYKDGNKRNPVVHGLQVVDAIISLVARRRPLMFFSFPGFLAAATGLLLTFSGLESSSGHWSMLVAVLIMGGLLLAVTGIVLHSVQNLAERIRGEFNEAIARLNPGSGPLAASQTASALTQTTLTQTNSLQATAVPSFPGL